jgi:hypothetical protein
VLQFPEFVDGDQVYDGERPEINLVPLEFDGKVGSDVHVVVDSENVGLQFSVLGVVSFPELYGHA